MTTRLQTYEADGVVVTYDATLCIHSGVCVRTLPGVFDPKLKRWVRPENAGPEAVVAAVAKCPSGALQSRLK